MLTVKALVTTVLQDYKFNGDFAGATLQFGTTFVYLDKPGKIK
jgi:hypothetical protein